MRSMLNLIVFTCILLPFVHGVDLIVYLNPTTGTDTPTSGTQGTPFKSVVYAVQNTKSGNYNTIYYNLATGTYNIPANSVLNFPTASAIIFGNNTAAVATKGNTISTTFQLTGGKGYLKLVGGKNITFGAIAFRDVINLPAQASAGSLIVDTPGVNLNVINCVFFNFGGITANADIYANLVNITSVPAGYTVFSTLLSGGDISIDTVNNTYINYFRDVYGTVLWTTNGTLGITRLDLTNVNVLYRLDPTSPSTFAKTGWNKLYCKNVTTIFYFESYSPQAIVFFNFANSDFSDGGTIATIIAPNSTSASFGINQIAYVNRYKKTAFKLIGNPNSPINVRAASIFAVNCTDEPVLYFENTKGGFYHNGFFGYNSYTNCTSRITPKSSGTGYSKVSAPVHFVNSVLQLNVTIFRNNSVSAEDAAQGVVGGAFLCSNSSIFFYNVSFYGNCSPDIICDGGCTSTGQITDTCASCARAPDGQCAYTVTTATAAATTATGSKPTTSGSATGSASTSSSVSTDSPPSNSDEVNQSSILCASIMIVAIAIMVQML